MNKILLVSIFLFTGIVGLFLSWGSIPNQEGYFEISWNHIHRDTSLLLKPGVTPLNYLLITLLQKILPFSLANNWKIMDLFFGALTGTFLVWVYFRHQKPQTFLQQITPCIVVLTSFGFIYSLTSMTGEGLSIFTATLGTYFWWRRKYAIGGLFFMVSFLAKYTIYLIAPGLLISTIIQIRTLTAKEFRILLFLALGFFSLFICYHSLKNWGDIALQGKYSQGFNISEFFENTYYFILGVAFGAPLAILFTLRHFRNSIFLWLALSSTFMLVRHYFYWHYTLQIIPFLILFSFTHSNALNFFSTKKLLLQLTVFTLIGISLPIKVGAVTIFPKHVTIAEIKILETEISKNYMGGKIGYYMNRPFDEPFSAYEISYMEPSWDFIIEDTEYVLVPTDLFPRQLSNFRQCKYSLVTTQGQTALYSVMCAKKE